MRQSFHLQLDSVTTTEQLRRTVSGDDFGIRAEVDQLKEGFAKVGVLAAIQSRLNLWKPLLCHTESLKSCND